MVEEKDKKARNSKQIKMLQAQNLKQQSFEHLDF